MPPRQRFPRLNSRFDVKHIRDDLNQAGLKDPPVYALASELNRLIITFNGDDFKNMVDQNSETGVIIDRCIDRFTFHHIRYLASN
jgi:uncharacterized protein DUF5615